MEPAGQWTSAAPQRCIDEPTSEDCLFRKRCEPAFCDVFVISLNHLPNELWHLYLAFSHNDDPSHPGVPKWRPCTMAHCEIMVFDARFGGGGNLGVMVGS